MGRYDLRLSEREFWRLTPREFAALVERREASAKRSDWRVAVAVIWLLAPNMEKGKSLQPADIYPGLPAPDDAGPQARVWYPGAGKKKV